MSDGRPGRRFAARPRTTPTSEASIAKLLAEVERLRGRFERAAREGRESFIRAESDGYDVGMLAVIHFSDLVTRRLPAHVADALPPVALEGLRATRSIAAHNYAGLDNSRLWLTVAVHAPALLDAVEAALRSSVQAGDDSRGS